MTEPQKPGDAMVSTPAAVPDTAKRQVVVGNVRERVVDTDTTAEGAGQHLGLRQRVPAEPVNRQRARSLIDVSDSLPQCVVR